MCLITKQKEPLIAQEDMKVYKVLNVNRISPSQNMDYGPDVLYAADIEENKEYIIADDIVDKHLKKRYHSVENDILEKAGLLSYGPGLHSCLTKERAQDMADCWNAHQLRYGKPECIAYPATIPKGSEYYLDETGLCISNKLVVH